MYNGHKCRVAATCVKIYKTQALVEPATSNASWVF